MIVADSSYLVEGILRDTRLVENETIVAPGLELYEVINTLWKHDTVIGNLEDSSSHIGLMLELKTCDEESKHCQRREAFRKPLTLVQTPNGKPLFTSLTVSNSCC